MRVRKAIIEGDTVAIEIVDLEGEIHNLTVPTTEWRAYLKGGLIQNTLTSLTIDERELIVSGLTPKMWDETFKEEE